MFSKEVPPYDFFEFTEFLKSRFFITSGLIFGTISLNLHVQFHLKLNFSFQQNSQLLPLTNKLPKKIHVFNNASAKSVAVVNPILAASNITFLLTITPFITSSKIIKQLFKLSNDLKTRSLSSCRSLK